jgi:hypothetical protein
MAERRRPCPAGGIQCSASGEGAAREQYIGHVEQYIGHPVGWEHKPGSHRDAPCSPTPPGTRSEAHSRSGVCRPYEKPRMRETPVREKASPQGIPSIEHSRAPGPRQACRGPDRVLRVTIGTLPVTLAVVDLREKLSTLGLEGAIRRPSLAGCTLSGGGDRIATLAVGS